MIQTKMPVVYGDRSEKTGIIKIEVRPIDASPEQTKYLVIDWDISSNSTDPINSKEVIWIKEIIDEMDAFLEANNDFSGMSKTEKEWKKIQLALMMDTQTNLLLSNKTIYRLTPDDWELSPESPQEPNNPQIPA